MGFKKSFLSSLVDTSKQIRNICDWAYSGHTTVQYLLDNNGYIISPCPHCNNCPISDFDWCHFVTRIERSKLHKLLKEASSPFEDEKYSYLVMSKYPINKTYSDRIMRHPIINKNNVSITICSNEGITTKQIYKNDPNYKLIKKSKCGDCF